MGEDMPLSILKTVKAMEKMSLQTLQNTRQAHLIDYEEEIEVGQTQEETELPRYNFRHLEHRQQPTSTQELETPPESSSRPKKRKSSKK